MIKQNSSFFLTIIKSKFYNTYKKYNYNITLKIPRIAQAKSSLLVNMGSRVSLTGHQWQTLSYVGLNFKMQQLKPFVKDLPLQHEKRRQVMPWFGSQTSHVTTSEKAQCMFKELYSRHLQARIPCSKQITLDFHSQGLWEVWSSHL